ncbi:MAG: cofactor-independent phosphoglycerate mutase [Candidatus Abyssobacteria bacterium SURF_5]|uniref:Cofactor-independent phosphoglycerate mutase n=1 Tax=Abyssobacteria bacterium (strain SURF_5) TaxID=2093360 RepID=A0A3A4NET0_ABYX5|nr:MAG: cofactor-independent phosphoglycerate mutase [Candidatus Abyssubacteria bacterium SURF_5]
MKVALLIGDGMADYPVEELDGLTPLEAAETPNMDRLAREGTVGLVRTVPEGTAPGSDIANLNLLGYDVSRYYTGRAPLECASRNIDLTAEQIAFRCNLVTVADETMVDYSAGHIGSEEAAELIADIDRQLGDSSRKFYAGVSYRHLLVADPGGAKWETNLTCTPPHDIVGQPITSYLPQGENQQLFRKMMLESQKILSEHAVNLRRIRSGKRPATMIWLWGHGKRPSMPTFQQLYAMKGAVISAVDLIRGLGKYAGLNVIDVPGATGYFDTNYSGKAGHGIDSLKKSDFLFLHVEAPDEAGHAGNMQEKIRAIENFDRLIVGPITDALSGSEPARLLVLPDHATPLSVRTHVSDPVPFVAHGAAIPTNGCSGFSEAQAGRTRLYIEKGFELLPAYLKRDT